MGGYYARPGFRLTDHARQRARERLDFPEGIGDLELEARFNDLLRGLRPAFMRGGVEYYKIPRHPEAYAVVDPTGLVTTVTWMGPHKVGSLHKKGR